MKGVKRDGRSFQEGGGLVRVDLVEANERLYIGGEKIMPDDIIGGNCMMAALTAGMACLPTATATGCAKAGECEGDLQEKKGKKVLLK